MIHSLSLAAKPRHSKIHKANRNQHNTIQIKLSNSNETMNPHYACNHELPMAAPASVFFGSVLGWMFVHLPRCPRFPPNVHRPWCWALYHSISKTRNKILTRAGPQNQHNTSHQTFQFPSISMRPSTPPCGTSNCVLSLDAGLNVRTLTAARLLSA